MKRLLIAALLALSSIAFGATLNPVQLLNPAGSTSGQAIVSTGASTAPAWANVPVANVTGAAPLASPTFTGTPAAPTATAGTSTTQIATTAFVSASPTITTPNIVGVTNGAASAAGSVGQLLTATGTSVALTTGIAANCTSQPLTAGKWMLFGSVNYLPTGSTTTTAVSESISATSATGAPTPLFASLSGSWTGNVGSFPVPMQIINISAGATYFLVTTANFSASTMAVTCQLNALRIQ